MEGLNFKVGDTVRVFTRDLEEKKVHLSAFEGVVIVTRGQGPNQTFTVRKIATDKVAVERIFPVNSPTIEKITVVKKGNPRRAKLYYLRNKK